MVNRTFGKPSSQLHERYRSPKDTQTQGRWNPRFDVHQGLTPPLNFRLWLAPPNPAESTSSKGLKALYTCMADEPLLVVEVCGRVAGVAAREQGSPTHVVVRSGRTSTERRVGHQQRDEPVLGQADH
jgi:hypothetical protein